MKSKKLLPWIFNPFNKIAGWNAFLIGIILLCVTTLIGYYNDIIFDGFLDIHSQQGVSLNKAFLFQLINVTVGTLIMFILGRIYAKEVRFQDILGTTTLARYPFFFSGLFGWIVKDIEIIKIFTNEEYSENLVRVIIYSIISFVVVIWFILLLYNAFKVSCNIKGTKNTIVFITSILLSEIITNIVLFSFNFKTLDILK